MQQPFFSPIAGQADNRPDDQPGPGLQLEPCLKHLPQESEALHTSLTGQIEPISFKNPGWNPSVSVWRSPGATLWFYEWAHWTEMTKAEALDLGPLGNVHFLQIRCFLPNYWRGSLGCLENSMPLWQRKWGLVKEWGGGSVLGSKVLWKLLRSCGEQRW